MLLRDPWLVSQSLMQLLYLLPPVFLLYQGFYHGGHISSLLVPVLVMSGGQLAGGLGDADSVLVPRPGQTQPFSRRQTSSRIATIAEALSSITWAGAAALVAAGSHLAVVPCVMAVLILAGTWMISPPAEAHAV